jgi:hypothetical protein
MLGVSLNPFFYNRNDAVDDANEIHLAFDIGFLCALEKIKFEISVIANQENTFDNPQALTIIERNENLISDLITMMSSEGGNIKRQTFLTNLAKNNHQRIADDL